MACNTGGKEASGGGRGEGVKRFITVGDISIRLLLQQKLLAGFQIQTTYLGNLFLKAMVCCNASLIPN